ncbi:MAG: YihY/virulence factor BrkB family protein [Lentisphaeraceae bacterium]|nr:YihY/virulence factor BrkB family protein [Lentisphaeraceae bacterium]
MNLQKVKDKLHRAKTFFTHDLWRTDLNPLSLKAKYGFISLRVLTIIVKGFQRDKCSIYAAALTNITIMSLVPTLAFVFAIAHGFGFYEKLKERIHSDLNSFGPELNEFLLNLIRNLEKMDMSAMGAIGLAIMFWTVISLMGKIEGTFNVIWGIKRDRDFITKVKEYFFTLMIVPTSVLVTSSITTALRSPKLSEFLSGKFGDLYAFIELLIFLISPISVALAFTYLYKFLPNTKVKFFPAFIAGIVTTIMWQILLWAYMKFQLGVSNFNAVYGTFATIPLFMALLYSSWMIILFGAELSFAIQNHQTFEDESKSEDYTVKSQLSLALYLMRDLAANFKKGEKWLAPEVLQRLQLPSRFGNLVLDVLCKGNVMKCVNEIEGEYLPAKSLTEMTLYDVYYAVLGDDDKIFKNIKRKEYQELIRLNNNKLDNYVKDISTIKFIDLLEKDKYEVSNPKV